MPAAASGSFQITPSGTPPAHPPRRRAAIVACVLLVAGGFVLGAPSASADAPFGVGLRNITTDGFTHPWMGGYRTNAGMVWCIETAKAFPRASGNTRTGDLPAARGVSATNRNALAYALWAYGSTSDPTTAAALAVVVHGLSGDDHAALDVASMRVSDPTVKAVAVAIATEAVSRAFWVSDPAIDPWKITTTITHASGSTWNAVTTVTTSKGTPIAGHRVGLVPYNVTAAPGTEHTFTTDAAGRIRSRWTQADPGRSVVIDAQTTAPRYYTVWRGPDYPLGSVPQQTVTPNGTIYRGRGRADLPTGSVVIRKTTDNPAYQQAVGATFEVTKPDSPDPVGTLIVGEDGTSNTLELPVGAYLVTETWAPAGVTVNPTPEKVTLAEGETVTLSLVDPVRREATLQLLKVDSVTGDPVAGAELLVQRDSDGDGTYDETIGSYLSETTPITVADMAAGNYRITETSAPDGYELPPIAVQDVSVQWDSTATVTFSDHPTPTVTTRSRLVDDDGETLAPPAPPAGLADAANIVAPIGSGSLRDTVNITGLGADEMGTVTVRLYGPVPPDEALVCDAAHQVWSDSWQVTGPGDSISDVFTPTSAGRYGYVATLEVPDVGSFPGVCDDPDESALIHPQITTEAQAPRTTPGAEVTDISTITGLSEGTRATIETTLYGPFEGVTAIEEACAADVPGAAVGRVTDTVVGDGQDLVVTSSAIELPTSDHAGLYTFTAVLEVPGYPPITHPCGVAEETFEATAPPPPETTTTTTTRPPSSTTVPGTPSTTPPTTAGPPTPDHPDSPVPPDRTFTGGPPELPRTGAPLTRQTALGGALILLGVAGLALATRWRLGAASPAGYGGSPRHST